MTVWKRIVTTILAAVLMVPCVYAAPPAPSLSDTNGHWAEKEIRTAIASGWVDGYPDGTFKPEKPITRAEFTKMLLDAIHLTPDSETVAWMKECSYALPDHSWVKAPYHPKLFDMEGHWLTKQGWLDAAMYSGMVVPKDYNNALFRPEKAIARYEIALMADRALGLVYPAKKPLTEDLPFRDKAEFSDWKAGYIQEAVKAGIINGYPDGSFGAAKTATRAEAVAIVQRVLEEMEQGTNPGIQGIGQYRKHPIDGELTGVLLEKELDDVTFQEVDGIIYASVLDLYRVLMDLMQTYEGAEKEIILGKVWDPVEQIAGFFYENGVFNYQAGNKHYEWAGSAAMSSAPTSSFDSGRAFPTPPRLLYGEVMIPVYDFSKGSPESFEPWTGSWDENTRTLTIPFVDKKVFVNPS